MRRFFAEPRSNLTYNYRLPVLSSEFEVAQTLHAPRSVEPNGLMMRVLYTDYKWACSKTPAKRIDRKMFVKER